MTSAGALPADLAARSTFIAWGPPAYTNRTRLLAAELGVEVRHIYSTRRRGALAGLVKYPYQAVVTVLHLVRHRPRLVVVQNPPSFAAILVAAYAAVGRASFAVDAHSAAFDTWVWSRPEWIYRWVARRAATTIVTNDHFASRIRRWGGHASVVRDIPTQFEAGHHPSTSKFDVAVVCTFAPDEPIHEVAAAAAAMPDVQFFITGNPRRKGARVPATLPPNVELTGFLAAQQYYGLLRDSDAVMVLTTRDHTMQRGACEALSLGTPIVTSDWPLLRDYFRKGTVHVDNTATGIEAGLTELRAHHERYVREIGELRTEVVQEWRRARDGLAELLTEHVGGRPSAQDADSRRAHGPDG